MSSLEREVGAKQEAIGQYENQLTEIQAKYEACPKPEVVERTHFCNIREYDCKIHNYHRKNTVTK